MCPDGAGLGNRAESNFYYSIAQVLIAKSTASYTQSYFIGPRKMQHTNLISLIFKARHLVSGCTVVYRLEVSEQALDGIPPGLIYLHRADSSYCIAGTYHK